LLSAVGLLGGVGVVASTPQALTTRAAAASPPPCPAPTYPTSPSDTKGYAAGFAATLSGGSLSINTHFVVTGIGGSLCGLMSLPSLITTIQPQNAQFSSPGLSLINTPPDLVNLPSSVILHLSLVGPATANVIGTAPNGGLELNMTTSVLTDATSLGLDCKLGPVSINLTTNAPGGAPLTGPLTNATATVVGTGFALPAVTGTGGYGTLCPDNVAAALSAPDALNLPAPAGRANITMTAAVSLTLPHS